MPGVAAPDLPGGGMARAINNLKIRTPKMAKTKIQSQAVAHHAKPKRKRAGVHAKSKTSKLKTSKNYRKLSVGQG